MSSTAGTGNIKCPFFRRHGEYQISCEGVMEDSTTNVVFKTAKKKLFFLQTYCENHYEKCEYYRMLMQEKYKDE